MTQRWSLDMISKGSGSSAPPVLGDGLIVTKADGAGHCIRDWKDYTVVWFDTERNCRKVLEGVKVGLRLARC